MPKPNDLNDIFSLLETPQHSLAASQHFLFLLGTDTRFTRRPTKDNTYERGETLSYAAQVLVHQLDETPEIDEVSPLAYTSASVDVLNGPDTLGQNVGERIAQALFLALRAVAGGKNILHITAHSRGAVQGILVMHELERIKHALNDPSQHTLHQILMDSPCVHTKAAMSRFFHESTTHETPKLRALLKSRLKTLQIKPFLIDPVPGGRYRGMPYTRWSDERFYQPMPCHQQALLLCRDERTRCFIPIVPEGSEVTVIPGHHGTASGNLYTQQGGETGIQHKGAVQILVLYQLFKFYHQVGDFKLTSTDINLNHPGLDSKMNAFFKRGEPGQNALILEQYQKIRQDNQAYQALKNYNYGLGSEAIDDHRIVHYQGHHYRSLAEIMPPVSPAFINVEHASLYLRDLLNIDAIQQATPDVMVSQIACVLQNIVSAGALDGSQTQLQTVITEENNQALFLEGLSVLLNSIGQKYLRNHLSDEQKRDLMTVIGKPFEVLRGRNDDFSNLCRQTLQDSLKTMINCHYAILVKEYKHIKKLDDSTLEVLSSIEAIYQALSEVHNTHLQLKVHLGSQSLSFHTQDIKYYQTRLLKRAGQCLKDSEYDLRRHPPGLSESFYDMAKAQAIALDAPSPALMQAQEKWRQARIDALNSPQEVECQYLINTKLRPLTEAYLAHLVQKAQFYYPDLQPEGEWPEREHTQYEAIRNKYDTVKPLYDILKNQERLPSERISQFSSTLQEATALKQHRDTAWLQFAKSCFAALAVLMTGILPGVAAWMIYTKARGRSLLFFNQSHGERYSHACEQSISTLPGSEPPV